MQGEGHNAAVRFCPTYSSLKKAGGAGVGAGGGRKGEGEDNSRSTHSLCFVFSSYDFICKPKAVRFYL